MLSGCSVTWTAGRHASQPIQLTFHGKHGGRNPLPVLTNPSGSEQIWTEGLEYEMWFRYMHAVTFLLHIKTAGIVSFQFVYGNKEEQPNSVAVQLKLLQLLSKESHQNITFHCKNSVAYKDEKSSNLKKALVLRGSNRQEIRAQGNVRLRYTVIEDGCSVSLKQNPDFSLILHKLTHSFVFLSPRIQRTHGARRWLSTRLRPRPGYPSLTWPPWTLEKPIRSSAWTSALCAFHKKCPPKHNMDTNRNLVGCWSTAVHMVVIYSPPQYIHNLDHKFYTGKFKESGG